MTSFAENRKREAQERDDIRYRERQMALTVKCVEPPRGCEAPIGEDCRNLRNGKPLEHQAAHRRRIELGQQHLARQAEQLPEQRDGGSDGEQ